MTTTINKKAVAAQIYMRMKKENPNVTRKEIIYAFCKDAQCTPNGASTYYANFGENGIWKDAVSGLAKVDKQTTPVQTVKTNDTEHLDLTIMDVVSLTKYFNEHSSLFKVDRFSSCFEAIDAIEKYCK